MAKVSFNIPYLYNSPVAPDFYTTPDSIGNIQFVGSKEFWETVALSYYNDYFSEFFGGVQVGSYEITIESTTGNFYYQKRWEKRGGTNFTWWLVTDNNGTITEEPYSYEGEARDTFYIPAFVLQIDSSTIYKIEYTFAQAVATDYLALTYNKLPLKKWTITDVVNRCFDLIEPLKYGEKPRFRFQGQNYDDATGNPTTKAQGSQAAKYSRPNTRSPDRP